MAVFSPYTGNGAGDTSLVAALSPSAGLTIDPASILLTCAADASGSSVNYYDGTLTALDIGAGLLLTSGTTPGTVNAMPWFGQDNSTGQNTFYNGDADIDTVVNTVFQTQSFDATTLSFDFSVNDPAATSVSFDLVFGSDEFPEWVDQFVDCAVVMVNGVNVALFNHDPMHPLSVVSSNLGAGYFQDNENPALALPIEYDGVSRLLKIVAPILPGGAANHIKIGIADTGDHIYDSGLFIANLSAGTIPGSGVVSPGTACDDSDNSVTGSAQDEYFNLQGGNDIVYAGAGDDIVVAGAGDDTVYGGSGDDQVKGDGGNDLIDGGEGVDTAAFAGASAGYVVVPAGSGFTISANPGLADGVDTLLNVELAKFSDGLFGIAADGALLPVTDPGTTPNANTPGAVFITGIAAADKTLNATVSDADGIAGVVAWQWESSADGGANWTPIADADTSSYVVGADDDGLQLRATASFVDGKGHAESAASAAKSFVSSDDGDFSVELILLASPAGASVMNPLTTLLDQAITLGISPSVAAQYVNQVLHIDPPVDLKHYDAWQVLQAGAADAPPADAAAFAVEKLAVQVAVLASLSGDQTALATAQAMVFAGGAHTTLDLANLDDIAGILGRPVDDPLVAEIQDRNWNIFEAATVADIQDVWADILNGGLSTTLADLSVHVNQTPIGSASAELPPGLQDAGYTVAAATLIAGFSDPDGDALTVAGLSADHGVAVDNGDGSFTIQPQAGYAGPVELSYQVVDGQGGAQDAHQLFIALPGDHEASGTLAISGTVQEGATIGASTDSIHDPDGSFGTSFQWQVDSGSGWTDIVGATAASLAIAGDQSQVGLPLRVRATTIDSQGGTTDFVSVAQVVANVNDAPLGSVTIEGNPAAGNTLGAHCALADDDGMDPATIVYRWQADGADIATGSTLTLTPAEAGKGITVLASYVDAMGTPEQVMSAVVGIGLTLDGTRHGDTLIGSPWSDVLRSGGGRDTLRGQAGDDTLAGGLGNDILTGGAGADRYVFDTELQAKKNLDRIVDFDPAADTIVLSPAIFGRFTILGAIAPGNLAIGTAATLPTQYLVYDDLQAKLYYDADGNGAGAAVAFATLTGQPAIDWSDFIVGT
ncbi:MAG TPA: choice-of-anchor L domain-containing protein [Burkholderiaceae bacterium]|nr:choice-of-anchor L domain-containing protein [Burkholderiaceae bacterium]